VKQKRPVEVDWQATILVECDAAQMLGVYRRRNVFRDDRAPTTCAHNGDDHVTGKHRVALQLFIFLWCDESALVPCEFVVHGVIDAEYGDASVGEFGVEELAAKWACAYGVWFVCGEFINSGRREPVASSTEKFDEGSREESVGEFESVAAGAD
jgi:hypothetical protein